MFQYAAARAYQLECGGDLKFSTLFFDTRTESDRCLSLDKCRFWKDEMLADRDEAQFADSLHKQSISGLVYSLLRHMPRVFRSVNEYYWKKRGHIRVVDNTYRYADFGRIDGVCVSYGGFQNIKYFERYGEIIKQELQIKTVPRPSNQLLMDRINASESVCVHVRRGDFLQKEFQHLNICTKAYYQEAIRYMEDHLRHPTFFVFSNTSEDIAFIRDNWELPEECVYVDEGNADYEELQVMSACKHFILANSTFSWWAQYLSKSKGKIVCAPSEWDLSHQEDSRVMLMKEWHIIKTD